MKKITIMFTLLTCVFGLHANAQDTCSTAVAVADGVINTTTIVDGMNGAEMGLLDGGQDSSWFTFTPTADGAISVSSCLGGSDTRVYIGTGTCGSLAVVADNDDSCNLGDGNAFASQIINLPVTSGVTYYIEWDDRWDEGPFDWTLTFGAYSPPPANDVCSGANTITAFPYDFSQTDAILSTNNSGFITTCTSEPAEGMNDGLWFTFTPLSDGTVDITLSNVDSDFDSQLDLYSGSCGTLTCVINVDDGFEGDGEIIIGQAVTAGTQYFINVGYYSMFTDSVEGSFDINVAGTFTLSLDEFENGNIFTYFPNPVKNELSLKAQSNIQNVSIYTMLGQEVLKTSPNVLKSDINMNPLQSGSYFVKVTINDATETIRVIKQ